MICDNSNNRSNNNDDDDDDNDNMYTYMIHKFNDPSLICKQLTKK